MQSKAATVAEYLAQLPEDRRQAIMEVRDVILANLDGDFEEGMQYGMIGYYVPHRLYPAGYRCDPRQPLPFAALASQKNYMSLYAMALYGDARQLQRFQKAWAASGKKLDMGKSCIRFKRAEDLALDVIASFLKAVTVRDYIQLYEQSMGGATPSRSERPSGKKTAGAKAKSAKKSPAASKTPKKSATKTAGAAKKKTVKKRA